MTLKELRLKAGFTQEECAKVLNISLRTYNSYENNETKINSSKYNKYCKILREKLSIEDNVSKLDNFHTNVMIGNQLNSSIELVKKFKKRECYTFLKQYLDEDYRGRICILYGLRRTGKTTLLFQAISELPLNKTAYIKVTTSDNMGLLSKDLKALYQMGYSYVFIDEITLLEDFISTAAVLSDVFSIIGMKIVLSGTDSLGFAMADRDELYDRNIMIRTSYISFKEYSTLLDIYSVDKYIEYGGTLKMENMGFNDKDFAVEEVAFRNDESTRKYIDTAISRNIQHTLKNDNNGEYFNQLRELYDAGELTNVINRIVEKMNHNFLLKVVEERFKSHDLGSAKQLLLHDAPKERATVLYDINEEELLERLKAIIDVKEKNELIIPITNAHIEKVKKYLVMLDLVQNCPSIIESGGLEDNYIFIQPGMRYSIAKALVYSLMQDAYFNTISKEDKDYIISKILNDVKGKMLEDIVLLETVKNFSDKKEVFKFKFDLGGEFDMVVLDKQSYEVCLYEIKHSNKIAKEQTKHLVNEEKCNLVERKFGKITHKYVLYTGKNSIVNGIEYLNVEEFLTNLK